MDHLVADTFAAWPTSGISDDTQFELGPAGHIDLWVISLECPPHLLSLLLDTFSADEIERANRFVFAIDRLRYIVARYALRRLLSAYTGVAAQQIAFDYGQFGKPRLAPVATTQNLHFNISHSRDLALLGVATHPVGVDLEFVRDMPDASSVAQVNFAPAEFEGWAHVPQDDALEAFFACWTRKEAYIKAIGHGLSADLRSFEVSVDPYGPAAVVSIDGSANRAKNWSLLSIRSPGKYWAAVAIEFPRIRAHCRKAVLLPFQTNW